MNRNSVIRGKSNLKRANLPRGKAFQQGPQKLTMASAFTELNSLISEYEEIGGPTPSDQEILSGKVTKAFLSNDIKLLQTYSNLHKDVLSSILNTSHTNSLLHQACKAGKVEAVVIFLNAGANPNLVNKSGRTPLHKCYRYKDLVRILIAHKAKVNEKDKHGSTPMHRAAMKNQIEVMRELLISGGDLHARDLNMKLPLDFIADLKIKIQFEKIFMWHKSRAPLYAYKYTHLENIPENIYRYMISML